MGPNDRWVTLGFIRNRKLMEEPWIPPPPTNESHLGSLSKVENPNEPHLMAKFYYKIPNNGQGSTRNTFLIKCLWSET